MSSRTYGAWFSAGMDMWMLGAEEASVMALRAARIATGGRAGAAEAELMVKEKMQAAIVAQYQRMSHYGMAGFGTAAAYAKALGLKDDAKQLAATSKDITAADKRVSTIVDAVNESIGEAT